MASILVITQRVPFPPNKGEKLRTYHQIEYLRNLGHSLTVLSPIDSSLEQNNAYELSRALDIKVVTKALSHKLVRFTRGILTGQSLSEANFFCDALMKEVNKYAAKSDAILCSASSLSKYVFGLSIEKKPTLLIDFMDVDSDKWLQYANSTRWPMSLIYKREHKLIKLLEQKAIAHFDYGFIIAQAEYNLFHTSVAKAENLHILGNGIDQDEFSPNYQASEYIHFLFTGVMDYKPNVDAVIWFVKNCWEDIKKQVPQAKLTLAGMNPTKKVEALSKDTTIEVTGFVEDVMPFFNRADVFIAPFQIARGVQNKVLQAMACAIPVVSTSLGAEGIICEHDQNMLIADSPETFVSACVSLAMNSRKREEIGNKANQTITDNYSWNSILRPLEDAINKGKVSK